jgi:hypothetical protein
MGRMGLLRWLGPPIARTVFPSWREFPPELWAKLMKMSTETANLDAARRESKVGDLSFRQARELVSRLDHMPLIILSADWWVNSKPSPMKRASIQLREEMSQWSDQGEHRIVAGCDHSDLPILRPDAVAQAVQDIISNLNHNGR